MDLIKQSQWELIYVFVCSYPWILTTGNKALML